MKIANLILENFRGFYGRTKISIDDFTVFLGKNDQGKSTILEAIDIFIYEGKGAVKIENEDLNAKAKNEGIQEFRIGICFKELPNKIIIDETNETTLRDEYLLNEEECLEIWKTFRNAKIQDKETKIKCFHPINDEFIKNILVKKIQELQDFVKKNKINVSDKRKSAELRKAIREYYKKKDRKLDFKEIDVPVNAEGLKDIWNKLQNYLPVYALFHADRKNVDQDGEIQDPLKARIEHIFKRENIQKILREIAEEINKELKSVANGTVKKFKELSQQKTNIEPNIPDVAKLKWKDVYKGIGFITDGDIPLNKRGSGIRRLVLLSSFLAETDRKISDYNSHIIYAIEEPETSLHPDLQVKLIDSLKKLSKESYQILISTHSPALIRLFETFSIRYVEKTNNSVKVEIFNEEVGNKIVENLGLLPNIGKIVICVEGTNDENFLFNINQNIPELREIIDLQKSIESNTIAIIPMRGSNLRDWINRYALKNTNVVEFHLYDRDDDHKYKDEVEKIKKRKDGSIAVLTKKREIENYIPKEIIEKEFGIILDNVDLNKWDDENIPEKILEKCPDKKDKNGGDSIVKKILCSSCSKKITKNHLEKMNAWDEVKGWFEQIKELTVKVFSD